MRGHRLDVSTKIEKLFRDHDIGGSLARVAGETGEAEREITEEIDMVIRAKARILQAKIRYRNQG
jgi:hypothetical protein